MDGSHVHSFRPHSVGMPDQKLSEHVTYDQSRCPLQIVAVNELAVLLDVVE